MAKAIGPILDYTPPIVDQSVGNWVRGMTKRVAHEIKYKKWRMAQFREFVKNYVKRYQPIPYYELNHDFLDTWLNDGDGKYTCAQKKMFHRELDGFYDPQVKKRKLFEVNSFIKREFYTERKEPRIINAPSQMLKAVTAPYLKKMEEVVYDDHFIKHKTRMEVAEMLGRIQKEYSLLYETDYSSFEGTFSKELMASCELILFKRLLANNPEVYDIIATVDLGTRRLRSKFGNDRGEANLAGSRLSGCMWTSLGNGFTNYMVIKFIEHMTAKRKKLPIHTDFLVEGDDGLIGSSVELDWEIAGQLGLRLKCHKSHNFNELSFCGLCLGPQGLMPGSFQRVIEKFGYSTQHELLNPENQHRTYVKRLGRELIKAKAMSLLASNKAVPILQPLAVKIIELTSTEKVNLRHFNYYWEIEMQNVLGESMQPTPISHESRQFFADRYGIGIKRQQRIEEQIQQMTDVDVIMCLEI